jgi:hypothetical protein
MATKKKKEAPPRTAKLRDLQQDDRNANRGTARGMGMLEESIQSYGMGRPVLVDVAQRLIGGNKTHEVATDVLPQQEESEVIIVPTEGDELVANQRMDLDVDADPRARMLGLADNRVGEVNIEFDKEVLSSLRDEGLDLNTVGFLDHEQEAMFRSLITEQIAESSPAPAQRFDDDEEGDDLSGAGAGGERTSAAPQDLGSMHVRMVQVVFTKEQYEEYESMMAELGKLFGTATPTDTVWQTVMMAEETTREAVKA